MKTVSPKESCNNGWKEKSDRTNAPRTMCNVGECSGARTQAGCSSCGAERSTEKFLAVHIRQRRKMTVYLLFCIVYKTNKNDKFPFIFEFSSWVILAWILMCSQREISWNIIGLSTFTPWQNISALYYKSRKAVVTFYTALSRYTRMSSWLK